MYSTVVYKTKQHNTTQHTTIQQNVNHDGRPVRKETIPRRNDDEKR